MMKFNYDARIQVSCIGIMDINQCNTLMHDLITGSTDQSLLGVMIQFTIWAFLVVFGALAIKYLLKF